MPTLRVHTSPAYSVYVERGLLRRCGSVLRTLFPPCRAAIVTDDRVAPLYLETVRQSLESAGFSVCSYVFPSGEASKTLPVFSSLLEFFAREELTRTDCAVALGGGVVGDLTGFAAGCYLRGIPCVQLPTTLLAAVDSSVGGKTAVDLSAGKNLCGLFVQPAAVLCDPDALDTLPPAILADGAAEAIKTGVLSGEALFSLLEQGGVSAAPEEVIARCVAHKAGVVERDPTEQGERRLLNLGHTVGHAIELCSGYAIPHGRAVAAGLAIITRSAVARGWCSAEAGQRIRAILQAHALPTATDYPPQALAQAALHDKKRSGGRITLAIPEEIGRCCLKTLPLAELPALIAAGWEE